MSTSHDMTGFVLAGGKSRRMGRDKALLDWHGRTLLQHMVDLLSSVTGRVHVVGRDPLPDRVPDHGPLSGIATALETSETNTILVVAVDLPFLTRKFLNYLRSQTDVSNSRLIACKIGSDYPLCFIMQRTLLQEVQRRLDAKQLSLHGLIESSSAFVVSEAQMHAAGFDPSLFRNINTEDDYRSSL
jgi:molybdenum cofactor guanylyltransferase